MKKIVIGILAHVDSGKTTLTEALLYKSGTIRKVGRVDHGDAFLDTNKIEKERGITIFSKQAVIHSENLDITILDTPGHVDFSAETERTLSVLDYAILVISGTDGVQSHTETIWNLLQRYNVPTFIFVNKMDLAGADKSVILTELQKELSHKCTDFSEKDQESFFESLSLCHEELMEEYLSQDSIDKSSITKHIAGREVFPCFFGSALRLKGVEEFLKLLDDYTLMPKNQEAFSAQVYKIDTDAQGNRLSHMKITGGKLRVKDQLNIISGGEEWSEKVNQIRIYSGEKYKAVDEADAGTVCSVTGLVHTYPGEGLGDRKDAVLPLLEPVLNYRVIFPPETDPHTALAAMRKLQEEDPELHVIWNPRSKEIHLQLMGEIQLEVLKEMIQTRFGYSVEFGNGSILYKETIASPIEGMGHYEPLRHYAEVHLFIEPTERGSGLSFSTNCSEDDLDRNWQRLILSHLQEKTYVGTLTGSPITDMKISVIAGRAHVKHTEGGDFRQATYRAVRQGLKSTEMILLEPWYKFSISLPTENLGRLINDMQNMSASFDPPETDENMSLLNGRVPVNEFQGYRQKISGYTKGRAKLNCTLLGYYECHNSAEVIDDIGYDPETDFENTADSVFCSHGTGYVVAWKDVPAHVHIPPLLNKNAENTEINSEIDTDKLKKRFVTQNASDSDLMKIYEQTYGPIRKDPRIVFKPVSKAQKENSTKARPIPEGPEYLLVDGYNIIYAWDELSRAASENLEAARHKLINMMCNYQGFVKCELILVFDAYKVKGNIGEVEKFHNITIVYTKEAETADMYIEKATHSLAKNHRVRVATSDGLEQLIILGHGALRVSARSFLDEVKDAEKSINELIGS